VRKTSTLSYPNPAVVDSLGLSLSQPKPKQELWSTGWCATHATKFWSVGFMAMRSRIWSVIWPIGIRISISSPGIRSSLHTLGCSSAGHRMPTSAMVPGIRSQLLMALLLRRVSPAVNAGSSRLAGRKEYRRKVVAVKPKLKDAYD
jgi:hypothetical protein